LSRKLKIWCYRKLRKLKPEIKKEELKNKIKKLPIPDLLDLNIVIRKINKNF
jgi:hypothetical protein